MLLFVYWQVQTQVLLDLVHPLFQRAALSELMHLGFSVHLPCSSTDLLTVGWSLDNSVSYCLLRSYGIQASTPLVKYL